MLIGLGDDMHGAAGFQFTRSKVKVKRVICVLDILKSIAYRAYIFHMLIGFSEDMRSKFKLTMETFYM